MKTITIKKSNVALLLQTGKTNEEVAAIYGITVNEVKDLKLQFGFTKFRGNKVAKEYAINLIDDSQEVINSLNTVVETDVNQVELPLV
jgi:hypothetical protein